MQGSRIVKKNALYRAFRRFDNTKTVYLMRKFRKASGGCISSYRCYRKRIDVYFDDEERYRFVIRMIDWSDADDKAISFSVRRYYGERICRYLRIEME